MPIPVIVQRDSAVFQLEDIVAKSRACIIPAMMKRTDVLALALGLEHLAVDERNVETTSLRQPSRCRWNVGQALPAGQGLTRFRLFCQCFILIA